MNLKDCLKHFIHLELEAAKVYEKIAEHSEGEIAQVAKTFQNEEAVHAQRLEELLASKETISNQTVNEELLLLPRYGSELETSTKLDTRKQLFTFALQAEKDSILMYQEIANQLPESSALYQFFNDLIKEERDHMFFILKKLHELS
ncbi:hypothetical protein PRVXH_000390 [Proteinivorax hydrogeniformans]|uniref:Rubrerythrin n=1 Tax=Proteinivorax hydrogeniformans TaxID=1826727 RepID=A0AAU8HUK6_9FIRM